MNAANEVAVARFLQDELSFIGMTDAIEHALTKSIGRAGPTYLICSPQTKQLAPLLRRSTDRLWLDGHDIRLLLGEDLINFLDVAVGQLLNLDLPVLG